MAIQVNKISDNKIIFYNPSSENGLRSFQKLVHPDQNQDKKEIAEKVFRGMDDAKKEANKEAEERSKAKGEERKKNDEYPFEYNAKKDEICFLLPKVYKYNGGINNDVESLLTNNCEDFTKSNFNIEQQMLINERLYSFPDHSKREKIQKAYITLNDGKEHTNSEINDSILCTRDPDEC